MADLTAHNGFGIFQVLTFLALAFLYIHYRLSRVHKDRLKRDAVGGGYHATYTVYHGTQ